MRKDSRRLTALKYATGVLGVTAGVYATWVGATWLRYGHPAAASADDVDLLLDKFMPVYEVAERHHIRVAAPAEVTFAAACEQDLMALPIVRTIFKAREIVLGAAPDTEAHPRGLLAMTQSIGWGVLADVPGREIIMGAVTQPWLANVVFRPLPPDEFVAFHEPDYVKIAWTLRADAAGPNASVFRTETRVVDDRCPCTREVPMVLGAVFTGHPADSVAVARSRAARGRTSRTAASDHRANHVKEPRLSIAPGEGNSRREPDAHRSALHPIGACVGGAVRQVAIRADDRRRFERQLAGGWASRAEARVKNASDGG